MSSIYFNKWGFLSVPVGLFGAFGAKPHKYYVSAYFVWGFFGATMGRNRG